MKAAWYTAFGPAADVLATGALSTPEPSEGEVRVRVIASGVNPVDVKRRAGGRGAMESERVVPHFDGAGTVDDIGAGVSSLDKGDRVWLYEAQWQRTLGSASEYIVVPAHLAVPLPETASFADGACLGIPALTAHRCVFRDGPVTDQTILVTGGAGFIGANLVRALSERPGNDIVALDDLSFGLRSNLDGFDGTFIEGSILDENLLATAMEGVSSVVHLAARSSVPRSIVHPLAAHADNATGTALVLEAARAQGDVQVIVASSSSVYGANDTLPKHEGLVARPVSPYAASKLATEAYTIAWGHSDDLPVLALRLFNVFGPLQPPRHTYAAVIPAFLSAAVQGQPLPVHGDGTQCRDFTYVDTVVAVILDAIHRRVSHLEPLNLAFGTKVTLLEVISELEVILGRNLPVDFQPSRVGDVARSQADSSAMRSLFPDIVPSKFAGGLRATADWFESTKPWDRGDA